MHTYMEKKFLQIFFGVGPQNNQITTINHCCIPFGCMCTCVDFLIWCQQKHVTDLVLSSYMCVNVTFWLHRLSFQISIAKLVRMLSNASTIWWRPYRSFKHWWRRCLRTETSCKHSWMRRPSGVCVCVTVLVYITLRGLGIVIVQSFISADQLLGNACMWITYLSCWASNFLVW